MLLSGDSVHNTLSYLNTWQVCITVDNKEKKRHSPKEEWRCKISILLFI